MTRSPPHRPDPSEPPGTCGGRALLALATCLLALSACSDESQSSIPVDAATAEVVTDLPCRGGACSPCTGKTDGVPCDDDDPCTSGDGCVAGACVGEPLGCTCRSDADCAEQDDGDLCNGTLFCDLGALPYVCQPKPDSKVSCPAAGPCADATCQPASGTCKNAPKASGAACDDGDVCTTSACDGKGVCAVQAKVCACLVDADCAVHEDADLCNGTLHCAVEDHQCVVADGTVVTCPSPAEPCRNVTC